MIFRKLRIKLTLINLVLTSILLLIIFSGIYVLMKRNIDHSIDMFLIRTAQTEYMPPPPGPPKDSSDNLNPFFVKTTEDGVVKEISQKSSLSKEEIADLVGSTLKRSNEKGEITFKNLPLAYFKSARSYGYIIVFLDRSSDRELLSQLVIISFIVGAISLILVFIISLFLANKALIPVKNAWEKQKAFVGDASHELRTPLAVMNTNLELVLGNPDETVESQNKWLENIQSEIKRMTKLVEDLLFLARSDDHKEPITMADFQLSTILKESIVPFEPFAQEHDVTLSTDIQPNVVLLGNTGRIKQLINILIDNAIKHTPAGGIVSLKMSSVESFIEIIVSDTGEGIAKEHLDRIFERFYRVDKSRSSNTGGFGLGLSIAESVVKEHKGTISVSSNVGKGSTFKIVFPSA